MITSYEIQYDSCEKNKSAHLRMKSRGHVIIIFEDFLSIFCAFFSSFFSFICHNWQLQTKITICFVWPLVSSDFFTAKCIYENLLLKAVHSKKLFCMI